ncbi:hypothetical protein [Chryseobacterium daecheongense]|uniref:Lipoprotein n=1 Tax=Chryseobacterium daecheongense TaxID=192389 RepID=A0A3N0VTS6_9FLAO|nr:hypothetical protein [Chryseobacterium daecheongense]ROH95890.1 hypothetical protein EGI05_15340 [Chryseobacterium daecheongense]TDX91712.1 hypothetical protein BCF50_2850 [Chryseobacterium daecheongense]
MKHLLFSIICLCLFISCKKNTEQISTDIHALEKYITLPKVPKKVKYQLIETPIRAGGQDCTTGLSIYAVLEFSQEDFNSIVNMSTEKYTFPLQVTSESFKEWYPDLVKKKFIKKDNDFVMLSPPIFDGVIFSKKNTNAQPLFFTTENNEIFIIYKMCKN